MGSLRGVPSLLVLAAAGFILTACGGDDGAANGGEGTQVEVSLQEWAVLPEQDSAPSGSVTFVVTNTGPEHDHEFMVIRTELTPESLPTDHEGVVEEDADDLQIIGEIEEFPPNESRTGTFELEAGAYVLICNIAATDGGGHGEGAHYELGMRTAFTVT